MDEERTYSVFAGDRLLICAGLQPMLRRTKEHIDAQERAGADPSVLIFEDDGGRPVDFDFRGAPDEVVARVVPRVGPGRPRLGVVAREISLLPRHWEWLEQQRGGASAALRRLVDEARRREPERQRARLAAEATYRAMTNLAGDRPGYEEAARALYAGDGARFAALIAGWPADVVRYLERLGRDAFSQPGENISAAPPSVPAG